MSRWITVYSVMIACLLIMFTQKSNAEIYFPDTVPELKVKQYTRQNVKGKDVITFNVFKNQIYYVYLSSGEGTIINVSSPIKNIIVGAPELIDIAPEAVNGQLFFTIRPKGKVESFMKTTLQVITKEYNAIVELIISPYPSHQNKIVNLQDGRRAENQEIYTQERFLELKNEYNESIKRREALMSEMLFNNGTYYPIGQVIDVAQSTLELINLSIIDRTFMYNIEFRGNDKIALNSDKIFLYMTPYNSIVMTETKGDRQLVYPDDIILYTNAKGRQCATIIFHDVPETIQGQFYTNLFLSDSLLFDVKVNLDVLASADDYLFDIETR